MRWWAVFAAFLEGKMAERTGEGVADEIMKMMVGCFSFSTKKGC